MFVLWIFVGVVGGAYLENKFDLVKQAKAVFKKEDAPPQE